MATVTLDIKTLATVTLDIKTLATVTLDIKTLATVTLDLKTCLKYKLRPTKQFSSHHAWSYMPKYRSLRNISFKFLSEDYLDYDLPHIIRWMTSLQL